MSTAEILFDTSAEDPDAALGVDLSDPAKKRSEMTEKERHSKYVHAIWADLQMDWQKRPTQEHVGMYAGGLIAVVGADAITDAWVTEQVRRNVTPFRGGSWPVVPGLLKFCPALGWFVWSGKVWEAASQEWVFEIVADKLEYLDMHFQIAWLSVHHWSCETDNCDDACVARRKVWQFFRRQWITNAGVKKVRERLSADSAVRVEDPDQFDALVHLLNVKNGVVDLTDGSLHEHNPDWLMTRIAGAEYLPEATHVDIDKVLDALADMDHDTQQWVQNVLGSGCSGETPSDDVTAFMQGMGANGKSSIVAASMSALGNYAAMVPNSVLGGTGDAAVGFGEFRGRRLMVVEETPDEMRLPMKTIKDLTSGNPISARVLYKGPIEFKPTHTLVVLTNYRPVVKERDHGTWRRLALVHFTRTYGTGGLSGDPTLRDRVSRGEDGRAEAMLAWLVQGCIRWYAAHRALTLPTEVATWTRAWREESDVLLAFMEDRLEIVGTGSIPQTDLWKEFESWSEASGAPAFRTARTFNKALKDHPQWSSVVDARPGGVKSWVGVRWSVGTSRGLLEHWTGRA